MHILNRIMKVATIWQQEYEENLDANKHPEKDCRIVSSSSVAMKEQNPMPTAKTRITMPLKKKTYSSTQGGYSLKGI